MYYTLFSEVTEITKEGGGEGVMSMIIMNFSKSKII